MQHHGLEWHVMFERGRPIWLRAIEMTGLEWGAVSLAVWEMPGACKWEWEILILSEDQHVHGGAASSQMDAMAAAEAAALIVEDQNGVGFTSLQF